MKLPIGITYEDKTYRDVEIAPLTGRALKIIRNSVSNEGIDTKMYLEVLKHGIQSIEGWEGAIPVSLIRQIYWPDAEFIFMQLAKNEVEGEDAVVIRECPSCKQQVRIPVDFESIKVIYLDDPGCESAFNNPNRTVPFTLSVPLTTLDSERTPYANGRLGILTVDDWLRIFPGNKVKLGTVSLNSIATAIYELGPVGKDKDRKIGTPDVENMASRDIKMLERLYNDNEPGIRLAPVTCPNCGAQIPLFIDWVQDFLAFSSASLAAS